MPAQMTPAPVAGVLPCMYHPCRCKRQRKAKQGDILVEWGGAQRWMKTAMPAAVIREAAAQVGGHATRFRGGDPSTPVFTPPPPALERIHREVKRAFDPHGIFPAIVGT